MTKINLSKFVHPAKTFGDTTKVVCVEDMKEILEKLKDNTHDGLMKLITDPEKGISVADALTVLDTKIDKIIEEIEE